LPSQLQAIRFSARAMGPKKGEKFMEGKQLATRIVASGKW